ncbi:MAG: hypothetical protein SWY16_27370, partial [Cyanobacteriota bacterium]|nr:hypothetical protein [Cyanobacteriota bacterium]
VVTGLLGIVIELLTTDARETARTETQREMQMALEYISTDLREAVYVYDGACLAGVDATNADGDVVAEGTRCAGLDDQLVGTPNGGTPVIAFWKLEPLPEGLCGNGGTANVPCLAGRSYTLVVYYLVEKQDGGPWKGMARIVRYELPTYNAQGALVNTIDPDDPDVGGFLSWPGTQAPPAGNSATLVDFVDSRTLGELEEEVGAGATVSCPDLYALTPDEATLAKTGYGDVRNFYACVKVDESLLPRDAGEDTPDSAFNQKVILFVRGNAKGKPGIDTANEGFMPAIATQVLNRGVKDKKPR